MRKMRIDFTMSARDVTSRMRFSCNSQISSTKLKSATIAARAIGRFESGNKRNDAIASTTERRRATKNSHLTFGDSGSAFKVDSPSTSSKIFLPDRRMTTHDSSELRCETINQARGSKFGRSLCKVEREAHFFLEPFACVEVRLWRRWNAWITFAISMRSHASRPREISSHESRERRKVCGGEIALRDALACETHGELGMPLPCVVDERFDALGVDAGTRRPQRRQRIT